MAASLRRYTRVLSGKAAYRLTLAVAIAGLLLGLSAALGAELGWQPQQALAALAPTQTPLVPTGAPATPSTSVGTQACPQRSLPGGTGPATASVQAATAGTGAIITNGTVKLGVNPEGNLITDSLEEGYVGLKFLSTGNDALAQGCYCEGWGAADALTGVTGFADIQYYASPVNLTPVSFDVTASTAVSVVDVGTTLRVTHDYHPSASPNLYEITVTVRNISASAVDARYRRTLDWDVPPTEFNEHVTTWVGGSPFVIYNDNDGFALPDPMIPRSADTNVTPLLTGDFTDAGPQDYGALFDFGLGSIAPAGEVSFTIFYGAAANEDQAMEAIRVVGAQVYSLGQPSSLDGANLGVPNTFIFAQGTGGSTPAPLPGAAPTPAVPANPSTEGSTSHTQDPIHTRTGAFLYTHTDLSIPGRGPSPAFTRAYNSGDDRTGVLGQGWTHGYNIRLNSPGAGTGDLLLVDSGGWTLRYTRNPDGSYSPPPGFHTALVKNANNTYTVTHKDRTAWEFDGYGRLAAIADRYGNRSSLTYNAAGQLVSVSDPAGRGSLTLSYDATTGRLTGVSDWASPARSVAFGYDTIGRLATVTDREGAPTSYGYDGDSHRLATITDANNHVAVTNHYDVQGRVDWQKDARGLVTGEQTTLAYVVNGDGTRVTTVTYPAISHDPAWDPQVVDYYDALGRITRKVSKPTASSSEDVTTEYGYDSSSNLAWTRDGRGAQADLCYDVSYAGAPIAGSRGNLTRRIDPAPATGQPRPVSLFAYDGHDNLTQVVPPKGVASGTTVTCSTDLSATNTTYATDLAYDAATGTKLESVTRRSTDPELGLVTAVTKYEYTDSANPGLITRVIPPRGNTGSSPDYTYATTMAYFTAATAPAKAGLLERITDPLGNATTYDYDAVGRRTAMVDPNGNASGGVPADHRWEYGYDDEDRPVLVRAPAPETGGAALTTQFRYDAVGNRTVVIDGGGQVTKYAYDERDSLREVRQSPSPWTDPDTTPSPLVLTEYGYDHAGNLARVTRAKADPSNERATDYAYDGLNRSRTETQYPSWPAASPTLTTQYSYDASGNRTGTTDPLSRATAYGYDALGRLTSVNYADPATADVSYVYDRHGNRTSMADGTGATSYSYDEADRLLSVTSPGPKTVGYRYDADGNRTRVIYPDGSAVTYSFDKGSRLTSLTDWATRSVGYGYNPDGSLRETTAFNGTGAAYSYDNALRLTEVLNEKGAGTISRHTYTLDPVGNRTGLSERLPRLGQVASLELTRQIMAREWAPAGPMAAESATATASPGASATATPETAEATATAATATPGGAATATLAPTAMAAQATPMATATTAPAASATATPVATATPTPTATATATPTGVGSAIPWREAGPDAKEPWRFLAETAGYRLGLLDRDSLHATMLVTDAATGAWLRLMLPGNTTGAMARADGVGVSVATGQPMEAVWRTREGAITQELVLSSRPPEDRVVILLEQHSLSVSEAGSPAKGPGLVLGSPVARDSLGRQGTATLRLGTGVASVSLDPAFLKGASYPVTVGLEMALSRAGSSPTAQAGEAATEDAGVSMAALTTPAVWGWGSNKNNELAADTTLTCTASNIPCSPSPIAVQGITSAPSLLSGGFHSLSPQSGGGLLTWGGNWEGELGQGHKDWTTRPVPVSIPSGTVRVGAGPTYSFALAASGTVYAWGDNDYGSLGDGTTTDRTSPVALAISGVTALAGGNYHTLALKADGTVWSWGANWSGELGDGTNTQRNSPVQVKGPGGVGYLTGVVAISARGDHSLALKGDGTVWGWGSNYHGKLGDGTTYNRFTPVQVRGPGGVGYLTGIASISAGMHHSLAVGADGIARSWGMNDKGQLGDGSTTDRPYPTALTSLGQVSSLVGGYYHTVALKGDGTVHAWGDNAYGQVGDGSTTRRTSPVQVAGLSPMGLIAAGGYFSLAGPGEPVDVSTAYAYDRLYRLVGVDRIGEERSYAYDPAGNRSSRDATSYAYDRADRITSAGGVSYSVDGAGNLVSRGADSFGYDQANRLKTASVSGLSSSYLYDGGGKRASKTVGSVTTGYTYDVNASLPVLLDDGGRKYVWGLGLAYAVDSSGVLVYHSDGLGSVRAITDGAGVVVQTYRYDEYGVPTESQGAVTQPFGYTGEQWDSETGLLYLRARMYDGGTGRFLQKDPLAGSQGMPESLNTFGYVGGNPTSFKDPSGLCRDPGGTGLRWCIGRFIPTSTDPMGFFVGDDRGPSADSDKFRMHQFISFDESGHLVGTNEAGTTVLVATDPLGGGQNSGRGTNTGCQANKSKVLDDTIVETSCNSHMGVMPNPFPIVTRVRISISATGGVVLSAEGTLYPSLEVWEYGAPGGPTRLAHYDANGGGTNPYLGLPQAAIFGPQPIPLE